MRLSGGAVIQAVAAVMVGTVLLVSTGMGPLLPSWHVAPEWVLIPPGGAAVTAPGAGGGSPLCGTASASPNGTSWLTAVQVSGLDPCWQDEGRTDTTHKSAASACTAGWCRRPCAGGGGVGGDDAAGRAAPGPARGAAPGAAGGGVRCLWVMMAGDSNTRNTYLQLRDVLNRSEQTLPDYMMAEQFDRAPKAEPHCKNGLKHATADGVCDSRWADLDVVFGLRGGGGGGGCIRLSLRFMNHQSTISRLNQSGWGGLQYPFADALLYEPRHRLATAGYVYPEQPDLLWFSHGLWRLPQPMGPCRPRFKPEVQHLEAWAAAGVDVLWQTSPAVRTGEQQAEYARAEAACTRQLAQAASIPIFDMWGFTRADNLTASWKPVATSSSDECRNRVYANDVHIKLCPIVGIVRGVLWRWISARVSTLG